MIRKMPLFARALLAMSAAFSAVSQGADPDAWPTKPVRIIVPFGPGGATDIVARILAPGLSETLGRQFVVDNRAGAAGNIGSELVATARPDGYTILLGNVSTGSINPILFAARLNTNLAQELKGLTLLASIPDLLVSGVQFPPHTTKDLVEYAKARPGQLNYTQAMGSYAHLSTLDWASRSGMRLVNVPSQGAGGAIPALIGGEIHFSLLNSASVLPHVKGGRLKAFSVAAPRRLTTLPDVPTMTEEGFPINSVNWSGLFVPAKTPLPVVRKLYSAMIEVAQRPQVQEAFLKGGIPMTLSKSPEEFQGFVEEESKRWARIIKENNISLD